VANAQLSAGRSDFFSFFLITPLVHVQAISSHAIDHEVAFRSMHHACRNPLRSFHPSIQSTYIHACMYALRSKLKTKNKVYFSEYLIFLLTSINSTYVEHQLIIVR
jgi:hypothetical protein